MRRRLFLILFLVLLLVPSTVAAQDTDNTEDDEILLRINGSDRVEAGEAINVVVIVRGDLEIEGKVLDAVIVVDGDMSVLDGARVDGTLVVVDGTLTLRDGSTTTGDIYLGEDANWIREQGATFTGDVQQGEFDFSADGSIAWPLLFLTLFVWLGSTLVAILGAVIFAGIGGRQLWEIAGNLSGRVGATVLAALIFWFGIGLIQIPLILTGIGILALPVLSIVSGAVWFLGYIAFGTRLGAALSRQRMDDPTVGHPYMTTIAGVLVLQLILLVTMAGLLGTLLMLLVSSYAGVLGAVFGSFSLILLLLIWLAGILGGGALALKAASAWSSD